MNTDISNQLNEMAEDIDAWGQKNFPIRIPKMGVLEELGEIAHCFLKRAQGIRKMDQPREFGPKVCDAVSDLMVYLMHDMFMQGQKFVFDDFTNYHAGDVLDLTDKAEMEEFFGNLSDLVSGLLQELDEHVNIAQACMNIAEHCEFDLLTAIQLTWANVKHRNWNKNRDDAHEQAKPELTELEVWEKARLALYEPSR